MRNERYQPAGKALSSAWNRAVSRPLVGSPLLAVGLIALVFLGAPGGGLAETGGADSADAPPPAFPGAEGYGRFALGGRGGDVYHVTTLSDEGAGSLRAGIESATGPRTIVFDTGGTIELKAPLAIEHKSRITIAGQTAPGGGITLKDHGLKLKHSEHLVIRYIRIRLGDENKEPCGPDVITADYCDYLILDHVSASWGIDGIHDTRGCKHYTIQWCILSEALHDSLHPKGPHAMCGSFRAPLSNITIHHNLFSTSRTRHPTIGGAVQEPEWIIDFRNNVIYNWSGSANVCDNGVNLVNNYWRPGPETPADEKPIAIKTDLPDKGRGHMSGNVFEGHPEWTEGNYAALDFERWLGPDSKYQYAGTLDDWKVAAPYDLGANTPQTQVAAEAYERVLNEAGASLRRDAVDDRVIGNVRERTGMLIDSQDEVGGWPDLKRGVPPKDSDRDGMPDAWERANGFDPSDPADRNLDHDSDGYTNLEEYLADLCRQASEPGIALRAQKVRAKPQVIATTDGEVDDRCSMIRFLMYANEWDIRGLIHSSSKYHWKGDETHQEKGWEPVGWLDRQLDAYAAVYPNLLKHDARYPSPEYLRSQVFIGNIAYEGDMEARTPGSDRIAEVLLEPDDSPIWLQAWGGANTIACALKTIREEHPDRFAQVAKKTRIYLITEQDNTLRTYIRPEWPDVQVLRSGGPSFGAIAYHWRRIQPDSLQFYFDKEWMTGNILESHGPLCALYEAKEGRFRSEGDTPAFLHVINTGLRSDEQPSYGGWGGRFAFAGNVWKSVDKEGSSPHSILRWAEHFQNDWAARADWCVTDYGEANHPPRVALAHSDNLEARPGEQVGLDADNSNDPDGDELAFRWWVFAEAGTHQGPIVIEDAGQARATLAVPGTASPGETLHVICTVTDSGEPPLARYARVIVRVRP